MHSSEDIKINESRRAQDNADPPDKANLKRRSQIKVDTLENSAKVCSTVQVTRELQNKEALFLTLSDWQKSKCDPLTTAGKEMGKSLQPPAAGCGHKHDYPAGGCGVSPTPI